MAMNETTAQLIPVLGVSLAIAQLTPVLGVSLVLYPFDHPSSQILKNVCVPGLFWPSVYSCLE